MNYHVVFKRMLFAIIALSAIGCYGVPYIESESAFNNFIRLHHKAAVLVVDRTKMPDQAQFNKFLQEFAQASQTPENQQTGAAFAAADLTALPPQVADDLDIDDDPATYAFFENGQLITGDDNENEGVTDIQTSDQAASLVTYVQPAYSVPDVVTQYVETPVYVDSGYVSPWYSNSWYWPLFLGLGFGWGASWWNNWGRPWNRNNFNRHWEHAGHHGRPGGRRFDRPRGATRRGGVGRPGTGAGIRPGTGAGIRPGTGAGIRPGTGAGIRPGTGAGIRPDTGAGVRPGTGAGIRPDTGAGIRPVNAAAGFRPAGRTVGAGRTGGTYGNRYSGAGAMRTSGARVGSGISGSGMRTGGMRNAGMRTGGMRNAGMRTGGMRTGGGMRSGGMRSGGMRAGSGMRAGGMRAGGARGGRK